jgi:hypothetical protein
VRQGAASSPARDARPEEVRLRRGLLFVAVVWSIAGAFMALDAGVGSLWHWSIATGLVPPSFAMPNGGDIVPPAYCAYRDLDTRRGAATVPADPAQKRQLRYTSWLLGLHLGFAAGLAAQGRPKDELPFTTEIHASAEVLGLPTPALPGIRHAAAALEEFQAYLQADPQCVFAQLAGRYGPGYGYLYILGALIGHAMPYRAAGTVFVPAIRYYGSRAGIPQDLWTPMIRGTLADLPGSSAQQKIVGIVGRLDQYIKEQE